jgi:hypothetical protein
MVSTGKNLLPEPLRKTSFANRQPDPAFQVLETAIFTPLQSLVSRHPFYPAGNKACTNFYSRVICQTIGPLRKPPRLPKEKRHPFWLLG